MAFKKAFRKLLCRPGDGENNPKNGMDNLRGDNYEHNDSVVSGKAHRAKRASVRRSPALRNGNKSGEPNRYWAELGSVDMFSIQEADGKYVDARDSFTPRPKWWTVTIKLIILIWSTTVLVDGIMDTSPRAFYLATFNHWAHIVTIAYLAVSFFTNMLRSPSRNDNPSDGSDFFPSFWLQTTWALFAIAAPSQVLAALIFWCVEYPFQTLELEGSLAVYGTIWVLLLAEGLWINRVPLRVNQQWLFLGFYFLFLVWSLVHSYTAIGNPMEVNTDDLYPFLQWNQAPWFAILYSLVSLLVVVPLVFWFIWELSLWSFPFKFQGLNRRYLSMDDSELVDMYTELNS